MIVDVLAAAEKYESINPGFARGFEFLRRQDLAALEPGRHEIDGENVFALVVVDSGKKAADSVMEVHRAYIDIQFTLAGRDQLGWMPLAECTNPAADFDAEQDYQLFECQPETWCRTGPGQFAIFFPEDAHMPLVAAGQLHKVVIKVAVDPA